MEKKDVRRYGDADTRMVCLQRSCMKGRVCVFSDFCACLVSCASLLYRIEEQSSRSSLSNLHVFKHTHVSSSCSSCYIGEKLLVVWSSGSCGREDGGAIVWDESPNHNRKQQQQWNCVKEGECLLSAVSTICAPA